MKRNKIFIYIICCIIFLCCKKNNVAPPTFTLPPVITSKTYTADEITAFHQLTFNTLRQAIGAISKLPKNVYYYITDTSDAYFVKQVDNTIAEINLLTDTNLVVKRTNNSTIATAKIYFTDTTHFFAAVPGAKEAFHSYSYELAGLTLIDWNNNNLINRDDIFIDKDSAEKDTSALLFFTHHEIMHSLGMLGHTDIVHFGSVMFIYSSKPYTANYTYFDKRMIQLFYNPAILPGMNQQQVDDVIANL